MVQVPANVSETNPEVAAPVVETKSQKKARLKAAAAAAATPEATPTAEGEAAPVVEKPKGEHGMVRSKDVPWSNRKIAVLSTLKALGATGLTSAKSAKEVVAACHAAGHEEIVGRDVRHYVYHGAAGGLTAIADKLPEGTPGGGYGFYLTTFGMEQDYDALRASLVKPPKAEKATTETTVVAEDAPVA